mmetsp:Transcript_7103/g.14269  ORF Transcript_7103/g.14269 Transcript_7103/m.14269 type:complete len:207 (-) Transcript_7103:176-796(-)|eukprot:CAMPEP_0171498996 /NCGR_PEP_ID=MMETSP0958-20121227/8187_1 /TAXON_ID=87120 /ORGANISM="Aurantiochytrium limacinum, Strain ATCCMYA-1381" /LENGTH=206 /DNA_ID=CAMNT_0012033511 /DNA_START=300 /DNA_END=920 /DNA_ORIENTATION=+
MIYLNSNPLSALAMLEEMDLNSNRACQKQRKPTARFALDVQEEEHNYSVVADLPGVAKQNVDLSFEKGVLSIAVGLSEDHNPRRFVSSAKAKSEGVLASTSDSNEESKKETSSSVSAEESTSSTENETKTQEAACKKQQSEIKEQKQEKRHALKYLVRERVVPCGVRRLQFESEVDFENIDATFDNGVLVINVPKAKPVVHKVQIQ